MEQLFKENEPVDLTKIPQIINPYMANDFIAFAFYIPMCKIAIGLGEQMDETISQMRDITHKEVDRFWDNVQKVIDTRE